MPLLTLNVSGPQTPDGVASGTLNHTHSLTATVDVISSNNSVRSLRLFRRGKAMSEVPNIRVSAEILSERFGVTCSGISTKLGE